MSQIRPLRLTLVLAIVGEILSLVWLGKVVGVLPSLGILLLIGIAGIALIRKSGVGLVSMMRAGQSSPGYFSEVAASSLLSGLAGLLLLIPGLVSDGIALLLLLPFTQHRIAKFLKMGAFTVQPGSFGQPPADIVDVEAVEIIEPSRRLD